MNPRLGIFAAFAALALADCSEVKADQTLAIFASNAIHVADAGSDLAQARKDLNDTIDKSNGGFRKDTEEAAAKYEEAKTTVAKWLHDYPKATQDQKKHADNALDSLKHHAVTLYDKYIKLLKATVDSRLAVAADANEEMDKAKGTSDEKSATERFHGAEAALHAGNAAIIAAEHAEAKIGN